MQLTLQQAFKNDYPADMYSIQPSECHAVFAVKLQQRMETYSNPAQVDKIEAIREDIEEVKSVMVENVGGPLLSPISLMGQTRCWSVEKSSVCL